MEHADPAVPGHAADDARPACEVAPSLTTVSGSPGGHLPARPSWDCVACGRPWPCDPAREHLVSSTESATSLTVYMYGYFQEANTQLPPPAPPDELYERFLAWTRRAQSG